MLESFFLVNNTFLSLKLEVMKKIAIILPKFSRYGGVERFGYSLSAILSQHGYEVDFICARSEEDPPQGVNVLALGRYGLCRAGKLLWFVYAAEQARKAGKYDLCISLGKSLNQDILRIGGGPLEAFWKFSQRAWPEGFARKFKMLRRRISPVNMLINFIERRQIKSDSKIVCVSHRVREWMLESYPDLDPERVQVVYNKPDLTVFKPMDNAKRIKIRSDEGLSADDIIVSTATTNFSLKGVATLIHALVYLPANFILHVAGDRNPSKYQTLARKLGVEDRIRFMGRVDKMNNFYGASDIFVLPSFYDACSNSVLEALACGLPVISSKDNGSSYFLSKDQIIDDPSDYKMLAVMIQKAAGKRTADPFVWPEEVCTGFEPYLEMVKGMLG